MQLLEILINILWIHGELGVFIYSYNVFLKRKGTNQSCIFMNEAIHLPQLLSKGLLIMAEIKYLEGMYQDSFFPTFLVDKLKLYMLDMVQFLEQGSHDTETIQGKLDEMTLAINALQDEFYENESELETGARDSIAETIIPILAHYKIDIDIEELLREREW